MKGRFGIVLAAAVIACGCLTQSNLPHGVTASNIRKVRLGMSRQDIEQLLGPPLAVELGMYGAQNAESLIYFRPLPPPLHYPMLWVHLRSGSVFEVYAKRHNAFDSDGVYGLSSEHQWESPRFIETFPAGQ
jgi:hypothetical protein